MQDDRNRGGIVWLASYPKSGNTWLRALLTNALSSDEEPADINALIGGPGAASRKLFDDWSGAKSSDLTRDEVERARPLIYQAMARNSSQPIFLKVHDAYSLTSTGEALFPADATRAVIYIVRHPGDVAVSYAHHRGCTTDEAVKLLENSDHCLASGATGTDNQMVQKLGSWSQHVTSWLDCPLPVHVVRYEDLHASPISTLEKILNFLGLDIAPERIARAVEFASFEEMSKQEDKTGFFESPSSKRSFFRTGQVGDSSSLCEMDKMVNRQETYALMSSLGYREK